MHDQPAFIEPSLAFWQYPEYEIWFDPIVVLCDLDDRSGDGTGDSVVACLRPGVEGTVRVVEG